MARARRWPVRGVGNKTLPVGAGIKASSRGRLTCAARNEGHDYRRLRVGKKYHNPQFFTNPAITPASASRLFAARVPARLPLTKIRIVADGRGGPQQAESHLELTLSASRKLLSLEESSFVVRAVAAVCHEIKTRFGNAVPRPEDLLSHVPLLSRGTANILPEFKAAGSRSSWYSVPSTPTHCVVDRDEQPGFYADTREPTFSPVMTRRIFPCLLRLKITIGRLLSRHRLMAVESITFRPRFRISR